MQKNFSLTQKMQIPQQASYSNATFDNNEIEKLSKSYEIHNGELVKNFLKKNKGLLEYINAITPLINNYFPKYKKCLTFCEDPEFHELDDITIYINSFKSSFEEDWKKLDELERELFYIAGFSTIIKGLVCLDLWFK
ncbi:hypothetical protein [Methanobrevibacter sp.]|uniref:hypothetical protein n=1 Tax=Methanobrevibacter sp. TaxID=66852 RepID=UPI0025EB3FAB|nr:hypothetical protein [Methanobrevibacter sp.]MBR4448367.1 hypothetical protein [Methanobrevibacter sp.]